MKNICISIFFLIILFSCGQRNQTSNNDIKEKAESMRDKVAENKDSTLSKEEKLKYENLRMEYFPAVTNQYSDFVITPIKLEQVFSKDSDVELFSNLLFYNPNTGQINYIDTSYIGYIDSYKILTSHQEKKAEDDYSSEESEYQYIGKNCPNNLIFLQIANSLDADHRSDIYSRLSNEGTYGYQHYLAITNHDGTNFITITPTNSAVMWWSFIHDGKGILASAAVDSNNNGKIDDNDETQIYYTNLLKPQAGSIVVPSITQQMLTKDFIKRRLDYDK